MVKLMHTVRVAFTIVLIAASAFVVGSGIAAIPYWENEPCIEYLSETGPGVSWDTQLVPYGTRCEREVAGGVETVRELVPSTAAWIAWVLVVALVSAVAVRFRGSSSSPVPARPPPSSVRPSPGTT